MLRGAAEDGYPGMVGDDGRQLRPGDLFAGYRIESLAGRGGMGLVYKAWQLRPERMVAVKVIMPELAGDPDFRARFEQEASLAAQIEHPNVIPIYGVGDEDRLLYIAMRFVESNDLGHLLRAHGRLGPAHAARLVGQVAAALDAAHARGLVHRDVKPANVLVTGAAPDEHLYLTDFGLTKRVADFGGGGMTATGGFVGTLDYIAPEQVSGRPVDGRGDVYALGCVLYQLLTGVVPFPRDQEVAKIFAHLSMAAPEPSGVVPGLPAALDEVVARAMAKDPDERFASAGELARAAWAACGGAPGPATAPSAPAPTAVGGRSAGPTAAGPGTRAATTSGAGARVRFGLPLPAAHFTGRSAELEAIAEALGAPERSVVTQVLTGLGGVGKSRLAARYVHEHVRDYDIVAWIHAEDGGVAALAELAGVLGVAVAPLTVAERAAEALRWLSACDERWLLVLDNVAGPEQLRDCCPSAGNGRVIVTTRDRGMAQFGAALAVGVFDERTAVDFLLAQAGAGGDRAGATRLARALGCLPLALSHAGAYCAAGTSFADYLELLGVLPAADLFDSHPEASYEQTVASTWQVSIEVAERQAPLAGRVLTMAAYLAPDAIPRNLFEVLLDDPATALGRKRLADALNALHRLSLAEVDRATVSVHRLLQKTIRDDPEVRAAGGGALSALAAVAAAFPRDYGDPTTWPESERLLPHALALAGGLATPPLEAGERLVDLLNHVCHHLLVADPGARALAAATVTSDCAQRVVGPGHLGALVAATNLADATYEVGEIAAAVALLEPVLADCLRILGPEHEHTLTVRRYLSQYLYEAGRTPEAIALEEEVLADCERILGPEHRETIGSRASLACFYCAVGRIPDAIRLEERVLADNTRLLGPEHFETLIARSNLASSYYAAGRTAEAIDRRVAVLADVERILGPEHRLTSTARAKLALSYRDAGRTGEAVELEERVLADQERLLGAAHPLTLAARANLAVTYRETGRSGEAIELGQRLVADRERILGSVHPETLRAQGDLAAALQRAGRIGEAIAVGESAVSSCVEMLGPEHPGTVAANDILAACREAAVRPAHAAGSDPGTREPPG